MLSPCCPRLPSSQVSGGATLQVSNSSSWGKGHPWVQRLALSPCPRSSWRHAGWPGMGTGVSMDGQAQGHTVGHARQDEASSKMLTQHQLSTIRGEGALGPAPMASPTPPPLHFTAHPATAPLLPLSQLGTNSSSTPPGGGGFLPKAPPAPQDGCAGAQRGPSPVGSPGPAAKTPPAICLAERRCRQ